MPGEDAFVNRFQKRKRDKLSTISYKHSVHTDDAQAYSTFGMRCWETGGPALKLCGQIADICPDEAFVKKLALHCTREKLEPCHMLCVVEDALAGGLPG